MKYKEDIEHFSPEPELGHLNLIDDCENYTVKPPPCPLDVIGTAIMIRETYYITYTCIFCLTI